MQNIVGSELRQGSKTVNQQDALAQAKFKAIYFGAHWAPPCRLFTKTLTDFYNNSNQNGKNVEVIFASLDGNEQAFEKNYAEMPWLAVPY